MPNLPSCTMYFLGVAKRATRWRCKQTSSLQSSLIQKQLRHENHAATLELVRSECQISDRKSGMLYMSRFVNVLISRMFSFPTMLGFTRTTRGFTRTTRGFTRTTDLRVRHGVKTFSSSEMTETNSEVDLTSRDGDVPHASLIVGATWYVEGRVHLGFFPQNLDYFLHTFSVICFSSC